MLLIIKVTILILHIYYILTLLITASHDASKSIYRDYHKTLNPGP